MIGDVDPWKIELLRIADRLAHRKAQRRWGEQSFFLVERDIMVAAYIIRKLVEARKLSIGLMNREIVVVRHRLSDKATTPDVLMYDRAVRYELALGAECQLSLSDLCNQIIHSFSWAIVCHQNGGLGGVFVSSDRQRGKSVYFAGIDLLIELLREVGNDVVNELGLVDDVIALVGGDSRTARNEWLMTSRSKIGPELRPLGT